MLSLATDVKAVAAGGSVNPAAAAGGVNAVAADVAADGAVISAPEDAGIIITAAAAAAPGHTIMSTDCMCTWRSHILPLAWCHAKIAEEDNSAGAAVTAITPSTPPAAAAATIFTTTTTATTTATTAAAAAAPSTPSDAFLDAEAATTDRDGGNGQWLQVVPRLCVGLKAFHFGAAVVARERGILLEHMASIPTNSIVLVVAGEIDCRHNGQIFHSPVYPNRKRHYPTTVGGVMATVQMYVQGLLTFASGPQAPRRVLVMPVRPPPPLDPSLAYMGGDTDLERTASFRTEKGRLRSPVWCWQRSGCWCRW